MVGVYRYAHGSNKHTECNKKRLYGGNNIVCIQCLLLICGGIIGHVESQNWVVVALGQWSYYIRVFHMR
jgi:hypothetical protein